MIFGFINYTKHVQQNLHIWYNNYKEENENTFESFTEIGSYVMFVKTINVLYRRPL